MNVKEEILALELTRQNIVGAVNEKGGELADNAPLNVIPQAINNIVTGDLYVLEGEMTLASESKNLVIYYTNDTPPINAVAFMDDYESHQENDKAFGATIQFLDGVGRESRAPIYWNTSGVITCSTALQDSGSGIRNNRVIFSSSRAFLAGTYKYKIIFEL